MIGIGRSVAEAPFEDLEARRQHDDRDRIGQGSANLRGSLGIDLEEHGFADGQRLFHRLGEGAVPIAVHGRVLEEGARGDLRLELLRGQEVVVLAGDLTGSRGARRGAHAELHVGKVREQAVDQRGLSGSARSGDHEERAVIGSGERVELLGHGGVRNWAKRQTGSSAQLEQISARYRRRHPPLMPRWASAKSNRTGSSASS